MNHNLHLALLLREVISPQLIIKPPNHSWPVVWKQNSMALLGVAEEGQCSAPLHAGFATWSPVTAAGCAPRATAQSPGCGGSAGRAAAHVQAPDTSPRGHQDWEVADFRKAQFPCLQLRLQHHWLPVLPHLVLGSTWSAWQGPSQAPFPTPPLCTLHPEDAPC